MKPFRLVTCTASSQMVGLDALHVLLMSCAYAGRVNCLFPVVQGYAAQQRGADVHMSDAHPGQTDRRTDRRGRGSRDRGDARRQRIDDRAVAPVDNGRYAQVGNWAILYISPCSIQGAKRFSLSFSFFQVATGVSMMITPSIS